MLSTSTSILRWMNRSIQSLALLREGGSEEFLATDYADLADFNPFNPRNPWLGVCPGIEISAFCDAKLIHDLLHAIGFHRDSCCFLLLFRTVHSPTQSNDFIVHVHIDLALRCFR